MLDARDAKILAHLRNNSRVKLTNVAKETKIPLSTVYDRVRYCRKHAINKHTSLLNFQKMGFFANVHIAISCSKNTKKELMQYLMDHRNINSLYLINFGADFMVEGIFKDAMQAERFTEEIEDRFKATYKMFHVVKEMKKEAFLTDERHMETMQNGQ